jgi:hypothetical protein
MNVQMDDHESSNMGTSLITRLLVGLSNNTQTL